MSLWILKPINSESGPWNPWYDKVFGVVVRAGSEAEARALAATVGGDELRDDKFQKLPVSPWQDPALTSCTPLEPDGPAEVILVDNHSA